MATSGRVNTNTLYDSFFWVKWEQKSQDITANKTTISWSCGVTCGHSFYANAIKWTKDLYINGVLVYRGGTYSNFAKGEHQIASGQLDITHGTDGKKTFKISSFSGWLYSSYNYSATESSHTLPQIPRKATITASPESFTDQDNPSITISNPGSFTMDVWLEPNPNGDHLCVRNGISLDANGKYTWAITDDEREQLRSKCPGKDCTIRIGVYTHIGSGTDADFHDRKFIMVESAATKPTVSMSIALDNGSLPSEFDGLYIQGKSRVKVTLSAAGKYGAGIQSLYGTMEGKTYYPTSGKFDTDVVRNSGNVEIVGYAIDKRDFPGEVKQSINVIEYSKPLVIPIPGENAILCYRSDSDGTRNSKSEILWVKAGYTHRALNGQNECRMWYRWKPANRDWQDDDGWHLLLGTEDGNEYSDRIWEQTFSRKVSFTIQIMATDALGEQDIKTLEVPTEDVALHLGKGGKNVTVGEYCDYSEERTFRSAWKAIFDDEVIVQGKTLADYIKSVMNGG